MSPTFMQASLLMLHRGAADSAPDISDVLRIPPYPVLGLSFPQIVDSHAIQVHCSNAVIIGFVFARSAAEDMVLLVPVRFLRVSADRTGLAGVLRIHIDHFASVEQRLVFDLPFQIVERPGYYYIPVFPPDFFRC